MPFFLVFLILTAAMITLMLLSKNKYEEALKVLDNKEYRLKVFLPMALFILEKLNYKYSTKYDRSLQNKYTEISGKKYSKFYLQIHLANKIVLVLLGLSFIFLISSIAAFQQIGSENIKTTNIKESGILERPSYGSGNKDIKLEAELQSGKVKAFEQFDVPLKEMPPLTEDEKSVANIMKNLNEDSIKGINENLSKICGNLNLPTKDISLGNLGVKIVWKSENEEIIEADGTVNRPQYGTGNKKVVIQAILSKGRASNKKNFKLTVIQSDIPISDIQKVKAAKNEIQKEIDEKSAVENNAGSLTLPTKIKSQSELKINWGPNETEKNNNEVVIPAFGFILLVIALILTDSELDKKIKKRRTQLQLDFPDFLNKFTLLVNAGMTVSRAWSKISEDASKDGPLYEEISLTVLEITSGKAEITSYENFAERCRISEITKFVSVIEQNIRKGNKELVSVLKFQVNDCWQMRKNIAKRLGEEASTKMLLPLMLMFFAIVLIVATPAVMAMQGF